MSLVEVILPGHYWDSWLYAGKMYLFQLDGTVRVLDWDQLVKGMRHRRNANRLLHLLLAQSNHLYSAFRSPTIDPTSRDQLNQAIEGLDGLVIEVSPRLIATAELTRIDNPLPFPHTDCAVYMHTIFAGNQKGLGRLQASDQLSGSNSDRVWDGPVVSLAAGYGSLAMASGSDGLFELSVWRMETDWSANHLQPLRRQDGLRTAVAWVYLGLYGASRQSGTYIRYARKSKEAYRRLEEREVAYEATENDIFLKGGYSWGGVDNFCCYYDGQVETVRFIPQGKRREANFRRLPSTELSLQSRLVAASTAHFGNVVEDETGLNLMLSDGTLMRVEGEPVNWRVFPRYNFYDNHLHVVTDSAVRILAFGHDFGLDQRSKPAGIHYSRLGRETDARIRHLLSST